VGRAEPGLPGVPTLGDSVPGLPMAPVFGDWDAACMIHDRLRQGSIRSQNGLLIIIHRLCMETLLLSLFTQRYYKKATGMLIRFSDKGKLADGRAEHDDGRQD